VAVRVACAAPKGASATRHCRWLAFRRGSSRTVQCFGRYRVTRRHGRLRALATTRRCGAVSGSSSRPGTAAPPAPVVKGPGQLPAAGADRPVLFGFNDNAVRAGQLSAPADADLAAREGANLTRVTFDWRYAEPSPGRYDVAAYDAIYSASLARGIHPLWIVMFAPRWAWAPGTSCSGDCRYPPGDAQMAAWSRMVAFLAKRYPHSAGIEVWNEPNLQQFWQGGVDPARYTKLLVAAHAAVKAVAPDMPVVGPAVSNNPDTSNGNMSMSDFLNAVYGDGGGPAMDAVSFHAYPWSLNLGSGTVWARTLSQVRSIRAAHGDGDKPLWITETGLSTMGSDPYRFSPSDQAGGLVAQYLALATAPDVQALAMHTLVDPTGPNGQAVSGYGVVNADLSPKPAFCALARLRTGIGC
jgi:hypothetical protein